MKNTKKIGQDSISRIIVGSVLVLYTLIFLFLMYWAITTAFKTQKELTLQENYFGLPQEWQWENLKTAASFFAMKDVVRNGRTIAEIPFATQILYTLLYAGGCAIVHTLSPILVAYATSRFAYRFNKALDIIVLITMIVPIVGTQSSMVSLLVDLNIYDTYLGLYAQKFFFVDMYYFVFVAVFKGVSSSYYEAAEIDGASEWTIMIKVAFPLILSSAGLVLLLHFMRLWNDYTTLMIYAPSHPSIALGLYQMMAGSASGSSAKGQTPVLLSGCIMIVIPVMILFIIFRNKLMGNLTIGGVKE